MTKPKMWWNKTLHTVLIRTCEDFLPKIFDFLELISNGFLHELQRAHCFFDICKTCNDWLLHGIAGKRSGITISSLSEFAA